MEFTNDDISYLLNLFKGREDVFALRWEKGNKKRLAFNKTTNQAPKKNGAFILYSCTKKEQKGGKGKADSHRTTQPKD